MLELDKQLHNTIEKLYYTVPGSLPGQHWQAMFEVVDDYIPIRGAWMGHSEWWLHEDYREGYQEFYKMPDDFAANYFAMSTEDEGESGDPMVIKALMSSDDNTLRLSQVLPDRDIRMATDAYQQWGRHYQIGDAVMFHDVFPGTKASVFIAFYRREIEQDFSTDEHQRLLLLKQHMMAAHKLCLQDIARRVDSEKTDGYLMVVDKLGLVYHREAGIEPWLQQQGVALTENRLPNELVEAIANSQSQWRALTLDVENIGNKGFLLLKLTELAPGLDNGVISNLTAKEQEVLLLLRRGLTIKQVANELNIAVSTASGYSKKIYAKLGVSGKHELLA